MNGLLFCNPLRTFRACSMLARPRADQDPNTFVPNEESRANAPEVEKIVSGDELGIKAIERKGYIKVRGLCRFAV